MTATEVPTRRRYGYDELPQLLESMPGEEAIRPSTLDVLWVLYDRILNVDADRPDDPGRDRFVLSKGHAPSAFYAVLAAKGFLDPAVLPTLQQFDSPLGGHPDRVLVTGAEIGSGSLGHGLPLCVGMAHGLRATGRSAGVFCLIGDGELDEGSNHEAIAYAGRSLSPDSPSSRSTMHRVGTAGAAGSPPGSGSPAGPRTPSTDATTEHWQPHSRRRPAIVRRSSLRRWQPDDRDHARRVHRRNA